MSTTTYAPSPDEVSAYRKDHPAAWRASKLSTAQPDERVQQWIACTMTERAMKAATADLDHIRIEWACGATGATAKVTVYQEDGDGWMRYYLNVSGRPTISWWQRRTVDGLDKWARASAMQKARRDLDRLVEGGQARREDSTQGGVGGGTPARWFAA